MKIAMLSPFYPFRGGLAQMSDRLATELGKTNQVKAFSFTTLYPSLLFPGQTQLVTDVDPSLVVCERVLSSVNPFSYIKTARRINQFMPDVLIIPYWMPYLVPAFLGVCRFLNKKIRVVALVHNALPHEEGKLDRILAKQFFKRCNAFITLSDAVSADLKRLVASPNILLHEHPIYDQYAARIDRNKACEQLGLKTDKKNLLFFGFIRDYKGVDLLISAMNRLDDSYQLVIAGECYGNIEKYEQAIAQSPFKENIILRNEYIPDALVTSLFSASDVLVLPYRSATQSGVVAIAYQMELPIIATNVGALGKAVGESQTGLVVETVNAEAIADSIQQFFAGDILQYTANLQKEKERLSWSSFTQAIDQFLQA